MPNGDDNFIDHCCVIPKAVEVRTIEIGCDRRAFSRRKIRAGEVILRNLPTAHTIFREHRKERCARCLSTTRRRQQKQQSQSQPQSQHNLLRCGGCKQIWYCSSNCQRQDYFFHKVECKQASILLSSSEGRQDDDNGGMSNAALLVRNFLALRVPRKKNSSHNHNTTKCRKHSDNNSTVWCGSDHFDNLIQYSNEHPLDDQERIDIQRAAQALWNQRKAINKLKSPDTDIIIINDDSRSDLEDQLKGNLRRFRVNNFGVTDSLVRVVASAVYPLGALLNHSCAPNCLLRYDFSSSSSSHEPPVMEIVAAQDIPRGEELTHSYVELVSPMKSRRKNLREIYGFDCHCTRCSCCCDDDSSATTTTTINTRLFQIGLPKNYPYLSPIELTRWVLQNYNPENSSGMDDDYASLAFADQDIILQNVKPLNDSNRMAIMEAAKIKEQQAQYFMMNGDRDGELSCLKEVVQILEPSVLKRSTTTVPLSLDLYMARCDQLGSLIVAGGEDSNSNYEAALIECEHIVSFLCLALKHVPNHSLLGLQLFTLGDLYEVNGETDKAQSTYIWARRTLKISQGNNSEMVMMLNEKIVR